MLSGNFSDERRFWVDSMFPYTITCFEAPEYYFLFPQIPDQVLITFRNPAESIPVSSVKGTVKCQVKSVRCESVPMLVDSIVDYVVWSVKCHCSSAPMNANESIPCFHRQVSSVKCEMSNVKCQVLSGPMMAVKLLGRFHVSMLEKCFEADCFPECCWVDSSVKCQMSSAE